MPCQGKTNKGLGNARQVPWQSKASVLAGQGKSFSRARQLPWHLKPSALAGQGKARAVARQGNCFGKE